MRRAKVDRNHALIVAALRGVGCSVQSLAMVGKGCPDALVGRDGRNYLLEIKADEKSRLRAVQADWCASWRGSVATVRTVEEALAVVLDEL